MYLRYWMREQNIRVKQWLLYDPEIMPMGLRQAHKELDEAIERCYRLQPFANDTERLEYLFKLYEEMTTKETLFAKPTKRKKRQ